MSIKNIFEKNEKRIVLCGHALAKLARADDIQIGRNRLYDWLRGMGVLMSNNIPYQKYIEKGYFSVKETVFETGTMTKTYQQTFVTSKGQRYITGLLKKYY